MRVLAATGADWSVFSVTLSSSYSGYGTATLDSDVSEISTCVDYVRRYKQESCGAATGNDGDAPPLVVLMGHSTGSQDVMHYISTYAGGERAAVDGAILQAPVSDREAILMMMEEDPALRPVYDELVKIARDNVAAAAAAAANTNTNDQGRGRGRDTLLPHHLIQRMQFFGNTPTTTHRFLSLASPDSPAAPAQDDLFSSDLPDARLAQTFGAIGATNVLRGALLVLESGADAGVPRWVSKEGLLERWRNAVQPPHIWHPQSGVVPGAEHAPSMTADQQAPREDIANRVRVFLEDTTTRARKGEAPQS